MSVMMITSCIFEQISFRFEGAMGFHCNGKAERKMTKRKYVCAEQSNDRFGFNNPSHEILGMYVNDVFLHLFLKY